MPRPTSDAREAKARRVPLSLGVIELSQVETEMTED